MFETFVVYLSWVLTAVLLLCVLAYAVFLSADWADDLLEIIILPLLAISPLSLLLGHWLTYDDCGVTSSTQEQLVSLTVFPPPTISKERTYWQVAGERKTLLISTDKISFSSLSDSEAPYFQEFTDGSVRLYTNCISPFADGGDIRCGTPIPWDIIEMRVYR